MIEPGDIFESDGGARVVVYYVNRGHYPCVFSHGLPFDSPFGSTSCIGGNVEQRFREMYPKRAGRMTVAGALKLARRYFFEAARAKAATT